MLLKVCLNKSGCQWKLQMAFPLETDTLMHVSGPGDLPLLSHGLVWRGVVMMYVESKYWAVTCHSVSLVHDFIAP